MHREKTTVISLALASLLATQSAVATSYDLISLPFSYSGGTTSATATLTTGFRGTLIDQASIEDVLNSATFSASLYGTNGLLTHLDNSNSRWELSFSYSSTPVVALDVSGAAIALSFDTIQEYTGAALILLSSDMLSVLQYRQENNVSNYNFVDFGFNAIYSANYPMRYGSTFTLPALQVDEPTTISIVSLGLGLIGGAARGAR